MNVSRPILLALGLVVLCAPVASAQDDRWDRPADLKPLLPPLVPLPPSSRLNPGSVGGSQRPYTSTPLQNPNASPDSTTPGIRLTIPSR
jgi:hypothetical protein